MLLASDFPRATGEEPKPCVNMGLWDAQIVVCSRVSARLASRTENQSGVEVTTR